MGVLVVGSVALDDVETPFGRRRGVLGGAGSYFSLAASPFTSVQLVGVIGDDFPQAHVDLFRSRGIDTAGLQRVPGGKTFRWSGRYGYDMNVAHTLDTRLNVFGDFAPSLPDHYRDARFVYLANITPRLQLDVLDQVRAPEFVGLDSMNFWIGNPETRADLARAISRVDAVFMNDAEVRQYTGTYNLFEAARMMLDQGPRVILMKKGEHGAVAVSREGVFVSAAFPLETVKDPTGAGDSFAGGFMGQLARSGDTSWAAIKRAMAFGSVVASFAVEDFSVDRLLSVTTDEIAERYELLRQCTAFESLLESDRAPSPSIAAPR
jgi:sugar/nucleoside kinase (ribokinase family)